MPFSDASRAHTNGVGCTLKRVTFNNHEVNCIEFEIFPKRSPNSSQRSVVAFAHDGLLGKNFSNLAVCARDRLSHSTFLELWSDSGRYDGKGTSQLGLAVDQRDRCSGLSTEIRMILMVRGGDAAELIRLYSVFEGPEMRLHGAIRSQQASPDTQ